MNSFEMSPMAICVKFLKILFSAVCSGPTSTSAINTAKGK